MDSLPKNRAPIFFVLTAVTLGIDLWSKAWAFDTFGLRHGSDWLINNNWLRFRWFTSLNEGALWGMGQGFAWVFALLSVAAFAGIVYWLFFKKAAASLWLTFALAFVSGGTLGNLYDRLGIHGITLPEQNTPIKAVRDFFHFQFGGTIESPALDWAIFNVADICLVTGAIMLMLQSVLVKDPETLTSIAANTSAGNEQSSPIPNPER
ncbi:MAG: signal peptidase II [Fuerstiella sp.]